MRSTRFAAALASIALFPGLGQAQIVDWCCTQAFPYFYCSTQSYHCSVHPAADGAFKASLPLCVNVGTFPDRAMWQPDAGSPAYDYPEEPTYHGNTQHEYYYFLGKHDQWAQDLKRYKQGLPPTEPHFNGGGLYDEDYYYGQSDNEYSDDLDAYDRALHYYSQQFVPSQASLDANSALTAWYQAACHGAPQGMPANCCIQVVADDNYRNFLPTPLGTGARSVGAWTASQCADPCSVVIHVNVSPEFLYQTLQNPGPDEQYLFHSAAKRTFFTGTYSEATPPDYEAFSFYTVILHEIGHWLGLPHSTQLSCANTCSGTGMIMDPGAGNLVPGWVNYLTPCDECMFRKLYCPESCELTVASGDKSAGITVFPNPSRGILNIELTTTIESTLRISIFNQLGVECFEQRIGRIGIGEHTRTLNLSGLSEGNYVCRIALGSLVNYVNFAIAK